jgi:hypothetical protein
VNEFAQDQARSFENRLHILQSTCAALHWFL